MSFFGNLAVGLGAVGSFVPGYGTALSTAAGIAGQFAGAPDQLALNPYPNTAELFERGGLLWGAPLDPSEYAPTESEKLYSAEPQNAPDAAGEWLMRQRKSWIGTGSISIWIGTGFGWQRTTSQAAAPPRTASVLRVDVINKYLARLQSRYQAMLAAAEPVFHYIDLRTYEEAELELRMRTAKGSSSGPQNLAIWRASAEGKKAKADWMAQREERLAEFESERADWLAWREGLFEAQAAAETKATLENQLSAYLDQVATSDLSAKEIVSGFAKSFQMSSAALDSNAAPGLAPESDSNAPLILAVAGLAALLLLAGEA